MRAPAVLLNVVIACVCGGFTGYSIARRESQQEIAMLRQQQQSASLREQEVRTQLEAALAARAALEQQAQHLQTELTERLQRLEDLAAKLNPPPLSPEADSIPSNGTEQKDNVPQ